MIRERHSRNIPALNEEDMKKLAASRVLVAGCGGLGGNVIEYLTRVGTGHLIVVDGDSFSESNLNRQILSTADNMGVSKALAAAERAIAIDPEIDITPVCEYITADNAETLMTEADIVVDALDNVESRLILEDAAAAKGLTIVHGAINGWSLQAMLVPPGSGLLHKLYYKSPEKKKTPEKKVSPSLSFTPSACASIQAAMTVRYLCGYETLQENNLLTGSMTDMSFELIPLG